MISELKLRGRAPAGATLFIKIPKEVFAEIVSGKMVGVREGCKEVTVSDTRVW